MAKISVNFLFMALDSENADEAFQQALNNFCKLLPNYVKKWKETFLEAKSVLKGISNLQEQIIHIIQFIKNSEGNDDYWDLVIVIEEEMQLDIVKLLHIVTKLNLLNQEALVKCENLESCSLNICENSMHIRGSAFQPSLGILLEYSEIFLKFYIRNVQKINRAVKLTSLLSGRCSNFNNLIEAFNIDLDNNDVKYLLAITQYVNVEE